MRIRTQLVLLVFAALAPVIVLTAALTTQLWALQRDANEQRYVERVSALRLALDVEIEATFRLLRSLSTASALTPTNAAAINDRFDRILASNPRWLVLGMVLPDGTTVAQRSSSTLPRSMGPDAETVTQVLRTAKPAVSNLVPINELLVTYLVAPMLRGDTVIGALYVGIEHAGWLEFLQRWPATADSTLTLTDRSGTVITRTLGDRDWAGRKAMSDYWNVAQQRNEGSYVGEGLDRQKYYVAYSRSKASGWVLGSGVATSTVESPLVAPTSMTIAGLLATTAIAWILALLFGRRISGALTQLADYARRVGSGGPASAPGALKIHEAETVRRAMAEASALLHEREDLLRHAVDEAALANRSKDEFLVAAQSARERLELALSSLEDQFFVLDREFRYVLVNRRVAEVTRVREDEVLGRSIFEVFPRLVGSHAERELREAMRDGQPRRIEYTAERWNRWFEAAVYPTAQGVAVLVIESTERKLAAESLRASEERLRFLDALGETSRKLSKPRDIMDAATYQIVKHLGATRCLFLDAESHGTALPICAVSGASGILPVDDNSTYTVDAVVLAALKEHQSVVVRGDATDAPATDESSAAVTAYVACPLMRDGVFVAAIVVEQNAPRAWTHEETALIFSAADRFWAHLERARATHDLRDADRRKDEFLATLSHELRNPLAPIRNAVQVLRLVDDAGPQVSWARDVVERQVAHHERQDGAQARAAVAQRHLACSGRRCRPLIDEHRHTIDLHYSGEAIALLGDEVRLTQVFTNLLNNAARYTPPGGTIRLVASFDRDRAEVRVIDTGIGIPQEQLAHVFDLFYQGDRSLERTSGGLGIGLSLVQRLVKLHEGSIQVRSAGLDRGSEFIVSLPATLAPPSTLNRTSSEVVEASPARDEAIGPMRIAVVDDNQDAAQTMATLLRLSGYGVRVAFDGQEGVELVADWHPHAAVFDLSMPRLNGYQACETIRAWPDGHTIALIALSGYGQDEDRARTRAAGFDAHLIKPVLPETLSSIIHETVTQRRSAASQPL